MGFVAVGGGGAVGIHHSRMANRKTPSSTARFYPRVFPRSWLPPRGGVALDLLFAQFTTDLRYSEALR
jgi:hypothetical protein